jgi:hypothetical protein
MYLSCGSDRLVLLFALIARLFSISVESAGCTYTPFSVTVTTSISEQCVLTSLLFQVRPGEADMRANVFTIAACALFALAGCGKEDSSEPAASPNETSARDAAPGPLSETDPPSTAASDPAQNETATDAGDQPPRQ